jgi:carbamoyltransferase
MIMATSSTDFIIGHSHGFHDAAASVIDTDGNIHYAEHTERLTGVKHDHHRFMGRELSKYEKSACTVFYERPMLKQIRQWFSGETISLKPHHDHYVSHHWSHAAGAYFTRPWADDIEPVCVVIDSIGEFNTASIWYKKKRVWSMSYPLSLGLFYSAVTKNIGLRPNRDEHITMAMSSKGIVAKELLDFYKEQFNKGLHKGMDESTEDWSIYMQAATAQHFLEEKIFEIMSIAMQYSDHLCYSGGVALNCVANTKIYGMFKDMWIIPNPGDSGASLGAAAAHLNKRLIWEHPYLGVGIHTNINPKTVARDILENRAVAITHGHGEFGPRALGNRSLLGDARTEKISNDVKTGEEVIRKIKDRLPDSPLAPMVLEEYFDKYFTGPKNEYMSYVCKANDGVPTSIRFDRTTIFD